jgi:hypothetical protein
VPRLGLKRPRDRNYGTGFALHRGKIRRILAARRALHYHSATNVGGNCMARLGNPQRHQGCGVVIVKGILIVG